MGGKVKLNKAERAAICGMVSGEVKALEERISYLERLDTYGSDSGFPEHMEEALKQNIKFYKKLLKKIYVED